MPSTRISTSNYPLSANWAWQVKRGVAFDSSTGWLLPNTARRSPDAASILKQRIKDLDPVAFSGYWPVCPDFVIERLSQSDRPRAPREKMSEWLANGARRGWLIDPEARIAEICRPGFEAETRGSASSKRCVVGGGRRTGSGLWLDLLPVWDPLAEQACRVADRDHTSPRFFCCILK